MTSFNQQLINNLQRRVSQAVSRFRLPPSAADPAIRATPFFHATGIDLKPFTLDILYVTLPAAICALHFGNVSSDLLQSGLVLLFLAVSPHGRPSRCSTIRPSHNISTFPLRRHRTQTIRYLRSHYQAPSMNLSLATSTTPLRPHCPLSIRHRSKKASLAPPSQILSLMARTPTQINQK